MGNAQESKMLFLEQAANTKEQFYTRSFICWGFITNTTERIEIHTWKFMKTILIQVGLVQLCFTFFLTVIYSWRKNCWLSDLFNPLLFLSLLPLSSQPICPTPPHPTPQHNVVSWFLEPLAKYRQYWLGQRGHVKGSYGHRSVILHVNRTSQTWCVK